MQPTPLLASMLSLVLLGPLLVRAAESPTPSRPNLIFVFTDDQQARALGAAGNTVIHTPHLDRLAARGVRFTNAFAVLSLCSPSRAAALTGRYGSANGVEFLAAPLREGERTFANHLRDAGYRTGFVGKWHLKTSPAACGFDFDCHFTGNGTYHRRAVVDNGTRKKPKKHIDEYCVDRAVDFLESSVRADDGKPILLFHCTQLPHMDNRHTWPAARDTLARYDVAKMPLPDNWNDDLAGKPPYMSSVRNRTQALKYGYDEPEKIRAHARDYYAVLTEMDAALGRLFDAIDRLGMGDNTYIVFMSDNGWMLGDHGLTSKVLAYDASVRVPMFVVGPGVTPRVDDRIVLNIDIAPTLLSLAGIDVPHRMHGQSFATLLRDEDVEWRDAFVYECLGGYGGNKPTLAAMTARHRLIHTYANRKSLDTPSFVELYDLQTDPSELRNVADDPAYASIRERLATEIARHRGEVLAQ